MSLSKEEVIALPRSSPVFRTERQNREDMSLEERRARLVLRENKDLDRSRKRQRELDATIEAAKQGMYSPPPPETMRSPRTKSPGVSSPTHGRMSSPPVLHGRMPSPSASHARMASPPANRRSSESRSPAGTYRMSPPSPSPTTRHPHLGISAPVSHSSATSEADDLKARIQHLRKSLDQSARVSPSPDFPPTNSTSPDRARQHAIEYQTERARKLAQQEVSREADGLRAQITTITYHSSQLEKERNSLKEEKTALQSKVEMLDRQLKDERLSNTAAEASMKASLEAQKKEMERLGGSQERVREQAGEADRLREELADARLQFANEKQQVAMDAQSLVNAATQERCKMEMLLSDLEEQNGYLSTEGTTLRATIASLEEELAFYRAQSDEWARENAVMKQALAARPKSSETSSCAAPTPPKPVSVTPAPVTPPVRSTPVPVAPPVQPEIPRAAEPEQPEPESSGVAAVADKGALEVPETKKASFLQDAWSLIAHTVIGTLLLMLTMFVALALIELLTEAPMVSMHIPLAKEYCGIVQELWQTRRWPATVELMLACYVVLRCIGCAPGRVVTSVAAGFVLLVGTFGFALLVLDWCCDTETLQHIIEGTQTLVDSLPEEFYAYTDHRQELAVQFKELCISCYETCCERAAEFYTTCVELLTYLFEQAQEYIAQMRAEQPAADGIDEKA